MTQYFRRIALPIFVLFSAAAFFGGCSSTCTYPDQRSVTMRFVNSMIDFPKVTLFINGKLFRNDYPYDPPADLGYYTTYADGTPLPLSDSLLFVLTSDPAGKDTLVRTYLPLDLHFQTVVAMGYGKNKLSATPKTAKFLRLIDNDIPKDEKFMQMKIVHAIPDFPTMDLYFKIGLQDTDKPFVYSLKYGENTIRYNLQSKDINGLTVTEAGKPKNIIFEIPYISWFPGFYVTIVLRGSSHPIGSQPIANPLVLADWTDPQSTGNAIFDFGTCAVRFVNGMRETQLSLLVQNKPPYTTTNTAEPRDNVPGQAPVLNVPADSISHYFPVGVTNLGATRWFFSSKTNSPSIIDSVFDSIVKNQRVSMIAVEKTPLGGSGTSVDHLILLDTLSCPTDSNQANIRVVNLSPDHTLISFTMGGRSVSMIQKGVEFFTVPAGKNNITFTDGASSRVDTLNVKAGSRPLSLFILPDKTSQKFPVTLTDQ